MAPNRNLESGPGRKRGRRTESLGNKMMKGLEQDPEEDLRQAEEVLRWSNRKHGPDSTFSVRAMNDVADQLARQGRSPEEAVVRAQALSAIRRSLGPDHDASLSAELKLAICLLTLEQAAEATPLLAHVVTGRADALGTSDPATLAAMAWSATAARQLGNLEAAHAAQEQVLAGLELLDGESPQAQSAALNLASTLGELDRIEDAERLVRHVLEIRERTLPPEDPKTLEALGTLTELLIRAKDYNSALELARELVERRTHRYGSDATETSQARDFLAAVQSEHDTL